QYDCLSMIKNSQGKIYYGLHFCPGVAQYEEPDQTPYRVFLNEETIRSMDPSFAGRPVFVEHVDDVDPDINELRKEADGWVIESFYNSSDGKHWVKMVIVSDRGERAIRNWMRLSNAYIPRSFKDGGLWNGVPYQKEITAAEYEHLAIVKNPRYEESVILTPDEFKQYNEQKVQELKKLSNSKGESKMKFNIFKRSKVENAIDPELEVMLPSGKSVKLSKLINDAYEKDQDPAMGNKKNDEAAKDHAMANMDHYVKMHDGSMMALKDAMDQMKKMNEEMKKMKDAKELDLSTEEKDVAVEGDLHNDEEEEKKTEMKDDLLEHPEKVVHDDEDEDQKAKKKALELAEHEDEEIKA